MSCSQDQTTRLVCQTKEGYQEISRPQVHGYDINSICLLRNNDPDLPFKLLSGGDEKVIRLFEAPYNFVKRFNQLCVGAEPLRFRSDLDNGEVEAMLGEQEEAARKQPLGLMNKPQILLANKNL